jgi:murein peptide amidase A
VLYVYLVVPDRRHIDSRRTFLQYERPADTCVSRSWGSSVEGRPLYLKERGAGPPVTIIFGGFHGDEPLGTQLVLRLAEYLCSEVMTRLPRVILVPAVNPDGLARGRRTNANGVDLNRNLPTRDWRADSWVKRYFPGSTPASEPETRALMRLLEEVNPDRIISIHTPLQVINYDGGARALADAMAARNHYPVRPEIGYKTPGSLGTYAGVERGIPVITLELPASSLEEIWPDNRDALLAAIRFRIQTDRDPPAASRP